MDRPWGQGNIIGAVYTVTQEHLDDYRIDASKKVSVGTRLLCCKHSGDCFYDYKILGHSPLMCKVTIVGETWGYSLSGEARKLTDREFHLLLAGENVNIVGLL